MSEARRAAGRAAGRERPGGRHRDAEPATSRTALVAPEACPACSARTAPRTARAEGAKTGAMPKPDMTNGQLETPAAGVQEQRREMQALHLAGAGRSASAGVALVAQAERAESDLAVTIATTVSFGPREPSAGTEPPNLPTSSGSVR